MSGPLSGLRVIELAGLGPAPFCGMILADLGAQVTRVDRMRRPDADGGQDKDFLGRGRRSIMVDLKHPEGPGVVRELAASADVLLEGFRPGVMERLGLGPQQLLAAVPTLVYGRMTGWGQSGPLASVHCLPRMLEAIVNVALITLVSAWGLYLAKLPHDYCEWNNRQDHEKPHVEGPDFGDSAH